MARITTDPPRSLTYRLCGWYSRRRFGAVLEPARLMAHNPEVLRGYVREERGAEKWSRVPKDLTALAVLAAAATIGCEWCVDFGHWLAVEDGVDPAKLRDLPGWRDSAAYTPLERATLEYAEAMSTTPTTVTDELVARLGEYLDAAQLVELTMHIAIENQRSRFNRGLGLTSQGFAEQCAVEGVAAEADSRR